MIAVDAVLLREDLAKLSASCDCDVVAKVDEHRPDLLVADVRMPPGFTDEGCAGPGPGGHRPSLGARSAAFLGA